MYSNIQYRSGRSLLERLAIIHRIFPNARISRRIPTNDALIKAFFQSPILFFSRAKYQEYCGAHRCEDARVEEDAIPLG